MNDEERGRREQERSFKKRIMIGIVIFTLFFMNYLSGSPRGLLLVIAGVALLGIWDSMPKKP